MKEQLELYLKAIKNDYLIKDGENPSDINLRMQKEFNEKLRIKEGQKYIKVLAGPGVHSFIVKEDGPQFKKGDILMPADWRTPAKNKARGNIFESYHISWTGPDYLRV